MNLVSSAGFLILVAASAASAQLPGDRAPRRLTDQPVEFPETFTAVRSLTALPDGRLIISDDSDKRLFLADFTKKSLTPLSRTGTGPREYQYPGGTYRAPGGGVMMYDQQGRRFLPISTAGEVRDVIPLPMTPTSWGSSDGGPDSFVPDSLGNLYTMAQRRIGAPGQDSLPLTRIDRRGVLTDTVGYLRQQEVKQVASPNPGISMGMLVTFAPRDVWAVAADGAVAIVKSVPYRVDWYTATGGVVRGAPVPFTPLRATSADRDSLMARLNNSNGARVSRNGQSMALQMPKMEPQMRETKPAFVGQVPRIDERGRIWVERSGAAEATRRVYDIFDRRGALVDRIELPAGSRIVGFDAASMYTVRKDEDDLLHLQRFKLP